MRAMHEQQHELTALFTALTTSTDDPLADDADSAAKFERVVEQLARLHRQM